MRPSRSTGRALLHHGFTVRQLSSPPDAAKREFVYGDDCSSLATRRPKFSRPPVQHGNPSIIGVRKGDYEFIVNLVVDIVARA